jgi:very-short-patch-repair endonuclease
MSKTHSNNYYNKNLKDFARKLRNNSTLPEVILWDKLLKKKQLKGYSFLRQRPVGNYIVDFFCKDLKLIIELDGEIHKFQKSKDKKREIELIELGYSVIRFKNELILNELFNVQRTLEEFVDKFEKNYLVNK